MYAVDVKKGDIVIVASDGLFDNVYDKDIEKIVTSICDSESTSAREIGIEDFLLRTSISLGILQTSINKYLC